MADESQTADTLTEKATEILTNFVNETVGEQNVTKKEPSTPEGQAVAYISLVLMACLPIFYGSLRSVKYQDKQKASGEQPETITRSDAARFPIVASAMLFGIYIFFKIFSQEYINIVVGVYFLVLGVFATVHVLGPYISSWIPASFPNVPYHLILTEGEDESKSEMMNYKFDRKDVVGLAICLAISVWYTLQKHWIANNVLGLAFALNGVELLQLNSIGTGCILLSGLFFYDIFWVFGTNVMITVAKNFNAPIKVVFPQDFLSRGIFGENFAMLGLGDIVIPGIFIALLLRFDISLKRNKKTYFYSGFIAYFLGLVATIVVMTVFQHPQPALLYLVPACLGVPLATALFNGDLEAMWKYSDEPETPKEEESSEDVKKKN
uniref:minor histocompatibility antigen H13-like n=1 Tax=Styela clava TaxID=7725 RepID=UPI0019393537|nr:minor histocompatibility antigen H13-like [Styela clava]